MTRLRAIVVFSCLFLAWAKGAGAQTFDTLVFGNATSEAAHALNAYFPPATNITTVSWVGTPAPSDPSATGPSDVVLGGLGLSARRLLPRTPNGDVYGGQIDITMKVDPVKQNYLTLKLWGSDPGPSYLILNCNGREVGNRHGGGGIAEDPLYFTGGQWFPNRFFYRTELLPLYMTSGKTSVTITIRGAGTMYFYAPIFTYVPQYVHIMNQPTPGLYTAYTHAGSIPDVSGEAQGVAPVLPTPRNLENETMAIANVESTVNSTLASKLQVSGTSLSQGDASFLSQCYDAKTNAGASWIAYPAGKSAPAVGAQIIAALDTLVTSYASNATVATNGWGGALGTMGDAIRLSWPLISGSMAATVPYGGTLGTITRQAGWSAALRASVDSGRYNRRTIANQDISCSWTIYLANRGLLLVDPANALNEAEASRYFKEACGLIPWIGNDLPSGGTDGKGGGPIPTRSVSPPYGPNWFMCTSKGTTKDGNGFVGSDYGELGSWVYHMGLLSGDAQIQARGILMTRARCQFRYPGADDAGFLNMMGTDPIGVRNNNLPGHYVYLGRSNNPDDMLMAYQGAGVIGADLEGYYQESINDGQQVRNFSTSDPYLPTRWAAIRAMPQTGINLPTASGSPDYAWVDEENMAVAAKHGEERFYANLFWRQPGFINGLAKVFHLTPTVAHLADVMVDDVRFRPTGNSIVTSTVVDAFATPEDKPVEAFGGLYLPTALRSDLSSIPPTNQDAGRGTGYTFRYGNWLVGINAHYSDTYAVQLPSNFTSAKDLISGQTMSGPVVLAPKTSVVFYLPTNVDPNPPPSRVMMATAAGGNGFVTVGWNAASSATSYNVLRSTSSGGPYANIASGLAGTTSYMDTTATNGTTYYYVLQSVNASGVTSGNSPEDSATPMAAQSGGVASPWGDADIGTSTLGSATKSGSTFTLKSGAGDVWNTVDGCHFAYQIMAGDGVITARVVSQTSTNNYAKSGLMMRDSLAGNASQASIHLEPAKRAELDSRGSDGGGTSGQSSGSTFAAPYWVRLVRAGSSITGYASADGAAWTQVGVITASLPYVVYVGLDTSPGNGSSGQTNTAVFDNVTMPLGATVAPAAPTGLSAVAGSPGVTLNWAATPGASTYKVGRGSSAAGPFTTIATGVGIPAFSDFGLFGGTYYYVVRAVNSAGDGANSSPVAVQIGAVPAALAGLTAATGSNQVSLSWSASAGATGYNVTRAVLNSSAAVIASGLVGTSYLDATATNGTIYEYGVVPVNTAGAGQGNSVVVMPPGGIPAGWQSQDIGEQQVGGSSYSGGTYLVSGGGHDIWSTADSFRYTYQTVPGNCIFTARLVNVQTTLANAYKVGLMIRNTVDAGSAQVSILTGSGGGFSAESRSTTGAGTTYSTGAGVPYPEWMRMVRMGNTIYLYVSADGLTWTAAGSRTATFNATVTVGLAVCSEGQTVQNTAAFDNVSLYLSLAAGGTVTANAGASGQTAAQAFDGNSGTKWYTGVNGVAGWLQYQFGGGASLAVAQYLVTSAADTPQRDPTAWQLQGSADGNSWTTLDTQTGQTFANRIQTSAYVISNPQAFPYYRLNVTANAGGSGYGIQLAELALLAPSPGTSTLAPLAPENLSAAWSTGQIVLGWSPSLGATSYNLKRATVSGGPYTTIAAGLSGTSYTDTGLSNGAARFYVVTAVNAGGESPNSPEGGATPYAPPATPGGLAATAGNAQVTLNWAAATGAASYNVKRATTNGGPYVTAGIATSPSYTDTGLANGANYYYVVTAVNLAAESGNSSQQAATPQLSAPTGLSALAGNGQAALSWNAVPNAAGYNVKRATVNGGPYGIVVSGLPGSSYTDTGLADGTPYYYVTSAVSSGGEGGNSAQASVTPLLPPIAPSELVVPFVLTNGTANITLSTSVLNRTYQLERSYTLAKDSWVKIGPVQSGGGQLKFSDIPDPQQPQAFYHIILGP